MVVFQQTQSNMNPLEVWAWHPLIFASTLQPWAADWALTEGSQISACFWSKLVKAKLSLQEANEKQALCYWYLIVNVKL